MPERVVVTGIGALTPVGLSAESSWSAIIQGIHGIEQIDIPYPKSDIHYAALIKGFSPEDYFDDKKLMRRRSRPTHLVVAAALQAVDNARLSIIDDTSKSFRRGVMVGSGFSNAIFIIDEQKFLEQRGRLRSDSALKIEPEQVASTISKLTNFQGPTKVLATACASGASAIAAAYKELHSGYTDVMIAAGVDSLTAHPIAFAAYEAAHALAEGFVENPSLISKCFSKDRRGFVLGECATALVLESLSHAKARGAEIIAEVKGVGETNGAKDDTRPDLIGQVGAMNIATAEARLTPRKITHGNLHGTGTDIGDEVEFLSSIAFRGGDLEELYLCGTKSMTAHGIGGTGAWEAAELALTIRDGIIPPTPNMGEILEISDNLIEIYKLPSAYQTRYIDYPLFSKSAVRTKVKNGFTNSFGFGDFNCVIVMGEVD